MALRITSDLSVRPHSCFLCNQPPSVCGPCVDTGKDVGKGMNSRRVYLCAECVQDLLKEFGLPRPKEAAKAIAKSEEYKEQIVALKDEIASLQEKVEAISSDIVKDVLAAAKPKTTRKKAAPKKSS